MPFLLLFVLYAPVIKAMAAEWVALPEVQHGPLVPVVAGLIVWRKRHELASLPYDPSYLAGALLLSGSFILLVLGTLGADYFLPRLSLLLALAGVLATLRGSTILRPLAFSLFLLAFMIRVPMFIYSRVIFQLKVMAAALAGVALKLTDIPVVRQGNLLDVGTQQLSVSQAAGGLGALLTLAFLAVAYTYFFGRKRWVSGVLLLSVVPIALLVSAARITITGLLSEYGSGIAERFYGFFDGWVMTLVSVVALIALQAALNTVSGLFTYAPKRRH